jgi:hypothetical protein
MASKVDDLLVNFESVMREPWTGTLSLSERVYFLVYDPSEQRRVDFRISDFENATKRAGKNWRTVSLRKLFPDWMAANDYCEAYFEDPEALTDQLEGDFKRHVIDFLVTSIGNAPSEQNTLVAITDIASVYGFCRLSEILNSLQSEFEGRLLIFFPGEFETNHYRLLDARDGWSYLARPITI